MTAWGGQAPGVVKVRLSGDPAALESVTALLAADASVEILTGPDGPYPNRRNTGARVYLTIRTGPGPHRTRSAHLTMRGAPANRRGPPPERQANRLDVESPVSAIGDLSCQLTPPARTGRSR